jgi:hypothetical protein
MSIAPMGCRGVASRDCPVFCGPPQRGKRCREYFERSRSGAETLDRYGRLFDKLAA